MQSSFSQQSALLTEFEDWNIVRDDFCDPTHGFKLPVASLFLVIIVITSRKFLLSTVLHILLLKSQV